VPSKGSSYAQFQRAVERGNVLLAVTAARDLPRLSLSDSLALLLLFAERDCERFERAAPRWHARLVLAAGDFSIVEAQATLAAIALLPSSGRATALELLRTIASGHATRLDPTGGR
jgi:hypothetical protein